MKKIASTLLLLLSSCATLVSGSTQTITLKVVNATDNSYINGASCIVTDGQGSSNVYRVDPNPLKITIHKGHHDLSLQCSKAGYIHAKTIAGENITATTVGNIFFLPGFAVDAVTGAYKKYPANITIQMKKR